MAVKLNLLPPEYGTTKGLASVLKITRSLGVISVALFLIFTVGVSAFFIISSIALGNLRSEIDNLKTQIQAENSTEQQMVLLKDRLGKIKSVLGAVTANSVLTSVNPYITGLSSETTLTETSIDSAKAEISLTFRSKADVSAFFEKLADTKDFGTITLSSFTYSPENGYLVGISAKK